MNTETDVDIGVYKLHLPAFKLNETVIEEQETFVCGLWRSLLVWFVQRYTA